MKRRVEDDVTGAIRDFENTYLTKNAEIAGGVLDPEETIWRLETEHRPSPIRPLEPDDYIPAMWREDV